ncbi:MAG TPA: PEP-CTERM sorting domain-containing protein, partial [Phycisphaerae bacterium]|nr:PEP-CTERM sorting domain-containing protein [Phycisphaerae bacterium]
GHAAMIPFETPLGSTISGLPVDAEATFMTEANQITLVLSNLQADPVSVAQNLSGFWFTISTGETVGTLTASEGAPRTVAGDGTYTDGNATETGWALSLSDSQFHLNVLGTAVGPGNTILGPPDANDLYASANGSIAGNAPHNPFLLGAGATFVFHVPGVTESSSISDVTFSFNTSPGDDIATPEPAALSLILVGGLFVLRRRRR